MGLRRPDEPSCSNPIPILPQRGPAMVFSNGQGQPSRPNGLVGPRWPPASFRNTGWLQLLSDGGGDWGWLGPSPPAPWIWMLVVLSLGL